MQSWKSFSKSLGWAGFWVVCLAWFSAGSVAQAADVRGEINQIREPMRKLGLQLRFLTNTYTNFRSASRVSLTKRLSDGQINFLLKDYLRASIILLDAVENKDYRGKVAWFDATYYLAESLYRNRNFTGATKYFRLLVRYRRRHSDKALVRLMEIASKTRDYNWLNRYFRQASSLPAGPLRDKIFYLRAKSVYNQKNFAQADQLFRQITNNNSYGARAQYFLAVIGLQSRPTSQSIPEAITRMETALRSLPDKGERKLRDIILLSLGRINLEKGQIAKALRYYRRIDRKSHVFDQALYEICWCYIRRGQSYKKKRLKQREYKRALQALEILLAFLPQSPFYPNAQLLQGHLQLQLAPHQSKDKAKMFEQAMGSYQKIAIKYRGVYREMDSLLKSRSNPQAFFKNLISRQLDQFRVASVLPKVAVRWMSNEALMGRTLVMLRDLRQMKKMLNDNAQIIRRLESVLNLGDQIDLSPTLKDARVRGTSIRSSTVMLQARLNRMLLKLVGDKMSLSERSEYEKMQKRLRDLSLLYMRTPKNSTELKARSKKVQKRIEKMQSRLHNIKIKLDYATRYLITARRWLVNNPEAQKLTPAQRNTLRSDANELEQLIRNLREQKSKLVDQIDLASIELGYAAANKEEQKVQRDYQRLILKERRLLSRIKQRLSSDEQQQMTELQSYNTTLRDARNKLRIFFRRLRQQTLRFRKIITRKLSGEKLKQQQYKLQVANLEVESKGLASQIAYNSFTVVRKKFYDLVLRAEVGVIDVAWREKQTLQSEKLRLTKNKNRELKVLDSEFRDLLQEVK